MSPVLLQLLSASVNILLLHQSENCLAEVEYNEKWEIQDFLKALEGSAWGRKLRSEMEKTREHFGVMYLNQNVFQMCS